MSTLPFLLSVADELDNINSQSYMDDFGLGFHPHRQYYRTPTIQLSLPASTDWMQQERGQRYRPHKFYYETQNNLQPTGEENEDEASGNGAEMLDKYATAADRYRSSQEPSTSAAYNQNRQKYANPLRSDNLEQTDNALRTSSSSSAAAAASSITPTPTTSTTTKLTTFLSSNKNKDKTATKNDVNNHDNVDVDNDDDDDDNIDNSVRMYNLSKKCCKNYHRHAVETNAKNLSGGNVMLSGGGVGGGSCGGSGAGPSSYKLHSKCMEGNNSSSDESLQKVSSSIEFLTCFLLKRSRAPSSSSSSSKNNAASSSSSKKS